MMTILSIVTMIFSLVLLVYNGSKFAMSDAVTPENAKGVIFSIRLGGGLFILSIILLFFF